MANTSVLGSSVSLAVTKLRRVVVATAKTWPHTEACRSMYMTTSHVKSVNSVDQALVALIFKSWLPRARIQQKTAPWFLQMESGLAQSGKVQ